MKKALVKIPPGCINIILTDIGKHFPNETGGILMGELTSNSSWIITHLTVAGPKAIHKRSSYIPDYEFDEKEAARIYKESYCNSIYLGDWHSHPRSGAYMSEKDRTTLRTIARSKTARMSTPIMIVVGTSPFELLCWGITIRKLPWKDIFSVNVNLREY